jgi:cell division protein FtsX
MNQLVSAFAVGILLLLGGGLMWMRMGLAPVVERLTSEEVITAYIDPSVGHEKENEIIDQIKTSLGAEPESYSLKLVTAPEFAEHLKDKYPDLYHELEDLGTEMQGIVPRYVSIAGVLPENSLEHVRDVTGVESAESSKNRYRHSVGAFIALRKVSGFLAFGIALALLTGLVHLARSNALLHQDSLKLLKLWGANDWVLNAPGILSATSVGLLGGAIAFLGWVMGAQGILKAVRVLSPLFEFMPQATAGTGFLLLFLGALLGLLAGALGRNSA